MNEEQFQYKVITELAEVKAIAKKTDRCLSNHLKHHWAITITILGSFLTLLAGAGIAILKYALDKGWWPF